MSPHRSSDPDDEGTEAERREIARRYRSRRGEELLELARQAGIDEPLAAGEFSSVPLEDLAAIPFIGAFAAAAARIKGHRHGLPNKLTLAVDAGEVVAIERRWTKARSEVEVVALRRWPRGSIKVAAIQKGSLKTRISFELEGEEKPLVLYTTSLRINPWGAEVIRLLGGEVPALMLDDAPGEAEPSQPESS